MKLTDLDKSFVTKNWSDSNGVCKEEVIWMVTEITQKDIDKRENIKTEMIHALKRCQDGEAALWIKKYESLPTLEVADGKAWTLRRVMLSCIYATAFPNRKKDSVESSDNMALAASLGIKINDAETELIFDKSDAALIKRYAHESNQPLALMGRMNEVFKTASD